MSLKAASLNGAVLLSPISLFRIVRSTHQRGVIKTTASPLTVRVYVVNGEIVPGKFGFTGNVRAHTICRCVPHDPTLFSRETTLAVFDRKKTSQDTIQYLGALSSLTHIVCHLRYRDEVIAVQFLIRASTLGLTLQFTHVIHLGAEGLQKIPSKLVSPSVRQD